ncbi:hypothetical protein ACK2M7_14205 [Chryseobacterium sp. TY4]
MKPHMELKTIILNDPIYRKYKISEFTESELINLFFYFDDDDHTTIDFLDSYCPVCKTETVFNSIDSDNRQDYNNMFLSSYNSSSKNPFIDYLKKIGDFKREFSCSINKNHEHNLIVIFKIIGDNFFKICQFPSVADLSNPTIEKYRKFNNEIYKELNRAIGLASHGIGVAPFVYLRRILEKHILYPIIQNKISEDTINQRLITLDFKSKLDELRESLPSFLTNNPRIYSILSKGIHELEEDECLNMFPIFLNSIELILDEEIERLQKINKQNEISKLINNLKV